MDKMASVLTKTHLFTLQRQQWIYKLH